MIENKTLRLACIQTNSRAEIEPNIETVGGQIRAAAEDGAAFVATPEMVGLMEIRTGRLVKKVHEENSDPALAAFRDLSRELGIWQLIGSLPIKVAEEADGKVKIANRSFLIDDAGAIAARYDKIHMFDVDLPGGESYRESRIFEPGGKAVTAETPWGTLGMTICYDLRFAYLYRALAKAGARLLAVPAAFTRPTGQAHWHILQRARAIETGCFVFAPAQCGEHEDGRKTYGHSLIVDPWGEILAEGGDEPGHIIAELDLARIDEIRQRVPSITHDRPFEPPAG